MRPISGLRGNPSLLDTEQAAEHLGVSARTLEGWRHLRQGPPFARLGRVIRYRADDLDAFIAARTVVPEEVA